MKKNAISFILSCCFLNGYAQGCIGTLTPHNSAILDVSAKDKGIVFPKLTKVQRTDNTSPAASLHVCDTDSKSLWYQNGSYWENAQAMPIVTAASTTELSFTVLKGATTASIQYTNLTSNLSGISPNSFILKFSSNTPIRINYYTDITRLGSNFNLQVGESFELIDFNNDGIVEFIYNSIS